MDFRKLIEASDRLEVEPINAFGVDCYIREWTILEREQFEAESNTAKGLDLLLIVAVRSLCDEKGKRLFKDNELDSLRDKSVADLRRVFHASIKLNRVGYDDVELEKKSS